MTAGESDDSNELERDVCAGCGERIAAESERTFGFGSGNTLCAACAIRRGGRYDAQRDAWDVAPDVTGLDDESYGASPHERRRVRHSKP